MDERFYSYPCPQCSKIMRLLRDQAAEKRRKCVTYQACDPMARRDIWNLLNSELRPPRKLHHMSSNTGRSQ